ncbi:MAG TPA: TonB-dependent receptor [Bryobacteraceae bacterium]|nr:TonB-dependent receptor [Bryobacteraceae bacterium]
MHLTRLRIAVLSLAASLVLPVSIARAQLLKGTILGTVSDQSHAVIPGVAVELIQVETNFHRTETTNESGFFAFPNLDPGVYSMDIKHPGFKETRRAGITLGANTTVRADFELSPGEITQVLEVTSQAAVLQTDRADTGAQVEAKQLADLSIANQRNYQNAIVTVPGATQGYRSNSPFFNSQESLQVPVNGLDRLNNFMIEGLDNNIEQDNNLTAVVLPLDAIQQVIVSTTTYDPEFGRVGAAAVNVIMKSGSNAFHGSLFEYHNDSDLQARNFFAYTPPKVPHAIHNQYGASAGGHIVRNKLFYFADFQGTNDIVGQTAIITVPTAAMRTGDFSASNTTIYDPATGNTATGAGRTPFPNQQIPLSRISPIFQGYMALLPPPTLPGLATNGNYTTDQTKQIYSVDAKVDYVLDSKNTMFLRYSLAHLNVTNPGLYGPGLGIYGGPSNSGFDATGPALNQSPGLNYSHIFSPSLVTEARFGIVRNRNDATNVDTGTSLSQKLGIPNSNLGGFWYQGLAEVFVNGYDTPLIGVNGCLPWRRSNTNFEAANNWTKTKGNHVISWGGDWRHENYFLLQTATFSPRGRFTFTAGPTTLNASGIPNGQFNALAAFELDQPNGIGRDLAGTSPVRNDHVYALYVHDKWQATPKLTLDLGARWEYWPASYPQFPGGQFNYDPNTNSLLAAGYGNIPMDLGVKNYPKNVYPRVGLAYRLNDKTVIRAGFGMSSFYRYIANWQGPVKQNQQLVAANSFVAAGSMATGFPTPTFFTIPSNGIITNAPNQSYSITVPNTPVPYAETWNFSIQRMLPLSLAFEVAYVGNHAIGLQNTNVLSNNSYNINAATVAGKGAATEPENILFGRTASTAYPVFEGSHYEALQMKLNRQFANGFMMTTSYTFGKSIDYVPYNELGYVVYSGLTKYNRKNTFTYTASWQLPFGAGGRYATSGPAKYILGGWQIGGLWTWESGIPLLFATSSTSNLAAALNAPGNQQWPQLVAPVQILGNEGPGQYWFTPSSFAAPAAGTIGNVGRNILYGPNLFAINASLNRTFSITERFKLTFRAEAFNLSNTPQFDQPDTTFGDAAFGQITTANNNAQSVKSNPNRLLQGSLRLTF